MTGSDSTKNIAMDSSQIGVQAGVVHGDIYVYTTFKDASPEEKFEAGVRFLNGGMPRRARQLIYEAVEAKNVTNKVYFYWLLALTSGRTRRELSEEEGAALRNADNIFHLTVGDEWADGVRTIRRLLSSAQDAEADLRIVLKEFDALGATQKALILRHLESFLEGPIENQMWHRALTRAAEGQLAGARVDRVWKFFQPHPSGPRVRDPQPPVIPISTWVKAVMATAILSLATIHLVYLLAQEGRIFAIFCCLVSITGGYFGARNGVEWRFQTGRRRAKDLEHRSNQYYRSNAPTGGFARKVDQRFDYYVNKYAPRGVERAVWLAATGGIRKSTRDELVEIYREQRVGVEKIAWLIRHEVSHIKMRWEKGTLWDYREELATSLPTRVTAVLGFAALAVCGSWAVVSALQATPLSAAISTVSVLLGGWVAVRSWLYIILEHRRYDADEIETNKVRARRETAFAQWQARLADKPSDYEMAAWLDCDRKVLLNEALQHYRLTMSNVIAHAFIEAPAKSTARARVRNGPWRYKKYQLLVFLLTMDGVRQLEIKLDFQLGAFHDRHRVNYRYEAVAAVRVKQADDDERKFELTLVNGPEINVQVTGPGMEELQQDEDHRAVLEATLDTAGLRHTLHVLEGIAAEGKEWIKHEHRRGEARASNLAAAMESPEP
jgi:hypothetical protein